MCSLYNTNWISDRSRGNFITLQRHIIDTYWALESTLEFHARKLKIFCSKFTLSVSLFWWFSNNYCLTPIAPPSQRYTKLQSIIFATVFQEAQQWFLASGMLWLLAKFSPLNLSGYNQFKVDSHSHVLVQGKGFTIASLKSSMYDWTFQKPNVDWQSRSFDNTTGITELSFLSLNTTRFIKAYSDFCVLSIIHSSSPLNLRYDLCSGSLKYMK